MNKKSLDEIIKKMVQKELLKEEISSQEYEDFDFEEAYKQSPPQIKKLLDSIEDTLSYAELKQLAAKFKTFGYYLDYGLDSEITYFGPLKK